MDRHLIIAVHGIGEQKPGETVDAIVGAATTRFPGENRIPVTVERDEIELAERGFTKKERLSPTEETRNVELFPVHLRRVKKAPEGQNKDEALFAEVFWADKSPAPSGPFWTIFDLLKVILGLGYIAMENVESTRGYFTGAVVHGFTWLFYGAIAPINAALLIGAGLLLTDLLGGVTIGENFPVVTVLFLNGLLVFLLGLYVWRGVARTYLVRIFGLGTTVVGAIILLTALIGSMGVGFIEGVCELLPEDQRGSRYFENLECFTGLSVQVLAFLWLATVTLAAIGFVSVSVDRFLQPRPDPSQLHAVRGSRQIFHAVGAAMVMFWTVFSSTFWLLFVEFATRLSRGTYKSDWASCGDPNESLINGVACRHLQDGLGSLSVTTGLLILLIFFTVFLLFQRRKKKETLYQEKDSLRRVILNPTVQTLFGLSLIVIWVAVLSISIDASPWLYELVGIDTRPAWLGISDPILNWFAEKQEWVTAGLLLLGLGIYYFSYLVSGALGIARDIVTYAIQDYCMLGENREDRRKNFRLRDQINDRFVRVMDYACETFQPTRITVISHSQGTVIATRMLLDDRVKAILERPPLNRQVPLHLITMGSPVTHIYRRYFPEFFDVSRCDMPKHRSPTAPNDPRQELSPRWDNIHRNDDFVGTRIGEHDAIDDPDLAKNHFVRAGGHSGYFTDFHVWDRLYNDIGFRLFAGRQSDAAPWERT